MENSQPPVVTFISDLGQDDYYVAAIKGAILSEAGLLHMVDITHNVKTFNIVQGAFIFKNTWQNFPKGTIHLLSINNYYDKYITFLAIHYQGHYFIGPDNGIFALIFDEKPKNIYELDFDQGSEFPLKDLYAHAVSYISKSFAFHEIGMPVEEITQRISLQPVVTKDQIRATVVHIDHFENVIVNVSRTVFKKACQDRKFALFFKRNDPIRQISTSYQDVPVGETICFFNSADFLEIAINMGKAASMHGLRVDDHIQIDFE